jgi:glutamyl-tRNA reductase
MLQLIGLKSETDAGIRGKFAIIPKNIENSLQRLMMLFEEVVIISTCNRTEIYINSAAGSKHTVRRVFEALQWDERYMEYVFIVEEEVVVEHLMELASGFHSRILGEDQILGQIRTAYELSAKCGAVKKELQRLFQTALACGKEFKAECEIYKIPVSASSIVVNEAVRRGLRRFMLIGYGDMGELTARYLLGNDIDRLYLCVREPSKVKLEEPEASTIVRVIGFEDKRELLREVEGVICCTSAPHPVIYREDIGSNRLLIFDLAVPRDVAEEVSTLENVEVMDIDRISIMDEENKLKRKEKMNECRYIIDKYVKQYEEWRSIREIAPHIEKLKKCSEKIFEERYKVFRNKRHTKDNEQLARVLLKSTADVYINRAIEVLKEEKLRGRADECLSILEKIFYNQN